MSKLLGKQGCRHQVIVQRIKQGDPDAEKELMRRCAPQLRTRVARLTQDSGLVEDVCQQALLILLLKLRNGQVAKPDRLAAYLFGIAKRLVMKPLASMRCTAPEIDVCERVVASELNPEEVLIQEQTAAAVRASLNDCLHERDREAMYRYYIYQQDRAHICRVMRLTSAQLSYVLCRARRRFLTRSDLAGRLA